MAQGQDGYARFVVAHLFVAATAGIIYAAAAMHFRQRKKSSTSTSDHKLIKEEVHHPHHHHHHHHTFAPSLNRSESGRFGKIEKFSDYVARQIGFKEGKECPKMSKLSNEYLKRTKGCDGKIYEYFANEKDADTLYVKLIQEFERCILSYFAFHWTEASLMISQTLNVDSEQKKLKEFVMAATRKQRFEKITKELKVTRVFSTLVSEMKAIRPASNGESKCTEVMVPVAHHKRSPVLLLMGGGMGAGKSTVLKDIMAEPFWSGASKNAVVVEADAFKETDVIYRALSSRGHHHDMLQTAELVHQSSTDAASSLLVTALNEGRDVIMDGTLSWEPFVQQTIAMARNVHKHRYRMGEGYKVAEDGTVTENYWEQIQEDEEQSVGDNEDADKTTKPYRIELVGVICDAYLAVVRGIRRAVQTGRAVRVKPQLKSHKRFANAFPEYCHLVDNARLYCTNGIGTPPKLIAWKGGDSNLLVDTEEIKCLKEVSSLNEEADCIYELNQESDLIFKAGSVWNDFVLAPTVPKLRIELKNAISKIEIPVL